MAKNPHSTNDPLTRDSMSFAENGLFYAMPWMNALFGEIFGANDQYRSQEWQDYMLTREQEWSDPAAQMERMKNAGINPNIAAQGIAGSPTSPSAPSSPSGSSAGAAGLGSMASMIGGVAGASEALQNANLIKQTTDPTVKEILSRTHKNLTSAGVDDKTAQRMALENVFIPLEHQLGLQSLQEHINLQKEQIGWYRQTVDNLKEQIREIDQHIELMKSQGNLADKQALVASKVAKQTELQNFQLNFDNNLRTLLKVNPNNPMAENIYIRALQGIDTSKDVDLLENINYKRVAGESKAERMFGSSKTPWEMGDKYLNRLVDFIRGSFKDTRDVDVLNEQILELMDTYVVSNPGKTRDDAISELYRLGFTSDEIKRALESR